jgi:hypothetical protein
MRAGARSALAVLPRRGGQARPHPHSPVPNAACKDGQPRGTRCGQPPNCRSLSSKAGSTDDQWCAPALRIQAASASRDCRARRLERSAALRDHEQIARESSPGPRRSVARRTSASVRGARRTSASVRGAATSSPSRWRPRRDGRSGWPRTSAGLEQIRAEETRSLPATLQQRLRQAKRRLEEELQRECRATEPEQVDTPSCGGRVGTPLEDPGNLGARRPGVGRR